MDSARRVRGALIAMALCGVLLLPANASLAVTFQEFVDPHPAPGNQFGSTVVALSTGNVVITSPYDDFNATDAGAVYLFNGATGALISTLRGSTASDQVGSTGVTVLTNGNYVVTSQFWDNGGVVDAGAVTWGNGTTGVSGVISAANSLVGTAADDQVGYAFHQGNLGVKALTNGNYVVCSPNWDNGTNQNAGAATWGNGTSGVSGTISTANSLVGSASDFVGNHLTALTNGNYVVVSTAWNNGAVADVGAVTWGNGVTGVTGVVSATNSLIGSATSDYVGITGVTALTNGNYVVRSHRWNNGAVADAGAATWGSGMTGVTGIVSPANSLVGTSADDQVGLDPIGGYRGVAALTNGNYVVGSSLWNNGAVVNAGAATWGSGTSGVSGAISAANSVIGTSLDDRVGSRGVFPLANGNYVICSPGWGIDNRGAATWGSGTTGVTGAISIANSLIGSTADDVVTTGGSIVLANGNYVICSPNWDNGAVANVGAATWCSGATGVTGVVSTANSLVGSTANDNVGNRSTALANGNYVIGSPSWDNGGVANAGAATWGNGTSGLIGVVSAANSLVGSTPGDSVAHILKALANGNYVVGSPSWDNGGVVNVGAATWRSSASGVSGVVSAANSLVGSTAHDRVSSSGEYVIVEGLATWRGLTTLADGDYVVVSALWDNGPVPSAGAATWGSGASGITGVVSATNSVVGVTWLAGLQAVVVDDVVNNSFIARFLDEDDGGGRVRVGPFDLPPAQPAPFTATYAGGSTYLHWDANTEPDFDHYNLHRGAATDFTPAPENRISSSPDTGYTDVGPAGAFYKLSAVDVNGNESGFALITPGTTVGVRDGLPVAFALDGVWPNPSRGNGLQVAFALPTGSNARFELLDVSGRRVLVREVGALGPGRHTVNLAAGRTVPPGLYWLRLTQAANQRTMRVTVIE